MSVLCLRCKSVLIEDAVDGICFYQPSDSEMHLIIKHEKRLSIVNFENDNLDCGGDTGTDVRTTMKRENIEHSLKKRPKSIPILCHNCHEKIGSEIPWGPEGTSYIALKHTKLSICGYLPRSAKEKLKSLVIPSCIVEWKHIEFRNDKNYFSEDSTYGDDDDKATQSESFQLLLPKLPLIHPQIHDLKIRTNNKTDLDLFHWKGLTRQKPRNYQIQAYVQALLQDLILILPTGLGKTLVACMLIAKFKQLNPSHMALFIVDKIPLVFQQASVIERQTGLRVCRACAETKTRSMINDLNDSVYDVLVITAGALVQMQNKQQIDVTRQFCILVVDECHHTFKGHVYAKILNFLKINLSYGMDDTYVRPRLLGLTASPAQGKNPTQLRTKLHTLRQNFYNAILFRPDVPSNPTQISWVKIDRDAHHLRFCNLLQIELQSRSEQIRDFLPGKLDIFSKDAICPLEDLLLPSTLGRLRSLIQDLVFNFETDTTLLNISSTHTNQRENSALENLNVIEILNQMKDICVALELADVMGIQFALPLIQEIVTISTNQKFQSYLHKFSNLISPRMKTLESKLLQYCHGTSTKNNISNFFGKLTSSNQKDRTIPRVLVMVHTRTAARQLSEYLKRHEIIGKIYNPEKVVGHGGFDGMCWFGEQQKILNKFRDNGTSGTECRLLVCTSVLEEGLDVPECDLIIRVQGIQSLIGFIQSRGRARKKHSNMIIMLSPEDLNRADKFRQQEELVKLSLSSLPHTSEKYDIAEKYMSHLIKNEETESGEHAALFHKNMENNLDLLNLKPLVTFTLYIPYVSNYLQINSKNYKEKAEDMNEMEFIENVINESFCSSGLSQIRVNRLSKVENDDLSLKSIFDSSLEYLIGVADINNLNDDGDALDYKDDCGTPIFSCVRVLTESWNFKLCAHKPIWIRQRSLPSQPNQVIKRKIEFEGIECTLGIWENHQTYQCQFNLEDFNCAVFEKNHGLKLKHSQSTFIDIKPFVFQRFILIDWNEQSTGNVCIFIPLNSTPSYFENEFRVPNDGRIVESFSKNNVLCITFPPTIDKTDIYFLQFLVTVDVYFTRIRTLDATHSPEDEFSSKIGYDSIQYCIPRDCFLKEKSDVKDALWMLFVLLSQHLGCFTPSVKKYLWNFLTEKINLLPEETKNPSDDSNLLTINPIYALIYALAECLQVMNYWSNAKMIFETAFNSFMTVSNGSKDVAYSELLDTKRLESLDKVKFNEYKVLSATMTPSRVIYHPPMNMQGSRLFSHFGSDAFVIVSFRDEQQQRLYGEDMFCFVNNCIKSGINLGGCLFLFFSASSSQLREQKAIFVSADFLTREFKVNDHNVALRMMRESIVDLKRTDNLSPSKCLSYLSLFCTGCIPTIKVRERDIHYGQDVVTFDNFKESSILTDGCGKIALSIATLIARDFLKLVYVPSAFQIRLKGAKGVVTVVEDSDSDLHGTKIFLRESMKKFEMGCISENIICVVDHSKWLQPHLNREIINLLTSISTFDFDPKSYVYHLQEQELKRCYQVFTDIENSLDSLVSDVNPFTLQQLQISRNNNLLDPLLISLLKSHYNISINNLVEKTSIPFDDGALLMGIADPLGFLQESEVYVSIDRNENIPIDYPLKSDSSFSQGKYSISNQDVAIWRNPCLHPGDVRTVRAISDERYNKWKNVIIFPTKGNRNLPLECSGGDLDGDFFYVVWDRKLVPPLKNIRTPSAYTSFKTPNPMDISKKIPKRLKFFDNSDLCDHICDVYSNHVLAKIATIHLAISDIQKDGACDPIAIELSEAQSYAVDYPKTGILPKIPEEAETIIEIQGYPDFMRKQRKTYSSRKILGNCYRRAVSFHHNFEDDFGLWSTNNTSFTLRPISLEFKVGLSERNRKHDKKDYINVKNLCQTYKIALDKIKRHYGLREEVECLLGRPMHWQNYHHNRNKVSKAIHARVMNLQQEFKNEIHNLFPSSIYDQSMVAKACIQASKSLRCLSLGLLVADKLKLSQDIDPTLFSSRHLGKERIAFALNDYFMKGNLKRQIESFLEHKLSSLEDLKNIFTGTAFNIRIFGSVSLGLLDQDSDIDLLVSGKKVKKCLEKETRLDQLKMLESVSIRIGTQFLEKREVFDAKVPLICLSLPSSLENIKVDIVCDHSGFLKARWLLRLFHIRKDLYIVFQILTRWARATGFVNKNESESGRLLPMGNFYAIILSILSEKLDDDFNNLTSVDLLEDINLTTQVVDCLELSKLLSSEEKSTYILASDLLIYFFRRLREICLEDDVVQHIEFHWGKYLHAKIPSQGANIEIIRKIEYVSTPAFHCLLVHADIDVFFNVSVIDKEVKYFTQSLPLNLSYRMSGAISFYESRLSMKSKADVQLKEQPGKMNLLLLAKGSNYSIQVLKRVLWNYRNSGCGYHARTQASRYFMEESSFFFLYGVSNQRSQVKFQANETIQKKSNIGRSHKVNVICINNVNSMISSNSEHTDDSWSQKVINEVEKYLLHQISKMPDDKSVFESTFSVRFGSMVVMNVYECLPATSLTLSIDQVHQAIEKSGHKRKEWDRMELDMSRRNQVYDSKLKAVGKTKRQKLEQSKAKIRKKTERRGIRSTFYPYFFEIDNGESQVEEKYRLALKDIGFEFDMEEEDGSTLKTSWNLSRGYEVQLTFKMIESDYVCVSARERPLNWIHGTIVGSSIIPDIRYLLRTTKPVSNFMKEAILPPGKGIPIKLKSDGNVLFKPINKDQNEQLLYIRKVLKTKTFKKSHCMNSVDEVCLKASIVLVEEYEKLEDGELHGPTKVCGLQLDFDTASLLCAKKDYRQWAEMVVEVSISLSKALGRHGVIR